MEQILNKITLSIQLGERFCYSEEMNKNEISLSHKNKEKEDNSIEIKDIDKNDVVNESDKFEIYKQEEKQLLIDKGIALKTKMENLIEKFNDKKLKNEGIYNIMQSYTEQTKNNKKKKKESKTIKELKLQEIKKKCRGCKIYTSAFFFLVFYLIGFFQLLDLFDSTKKETGIVFKSFFKRQPREDNATFKELYINSCFKNIPEFDFAFLTSFIGSFPLNYCGFFISSLCLTVLNVFVFLNFMRIDFEKTQFDFFDFFHISIYFIIFFITFGTISLFSIEKVSEGIISWNKIIEKYKEENKEENKEEIKEENKEDIKEENKEENKKENKKDKESNDEKTKHNYKIQHSILILISIGIIFAYMLNKSINYSFYRFWPKMYNDKFEYVFILIYGGSYLFSLIAYLGLYYNLTIIEQIDKEEKNFKRIKRKFWRVCGFLIYYEKLIKDNKELDNKENINDNNIINKDEINTVTVYNNNNANERKVNDFDSEKINYIPTNEYINTNEQFTVNNNGVDNKIKTDNNNNNLKDIKDNNEIKINCKEAICTILIPCYKKCSKKNENSKYLCASCKLGCRKFFFHSKNNEFKTFNENCCSCCECEECCHCCPACQCCECCKKVELKESYEEEEMFCYVYQVQRKCSWFCDLFYKNNIFSLLVHNILIEIGIIGFEKKLNENLENNSVNKNVQTLIIYLSIVIVVIVYYSFDCCNVFNRNDYKGFSYLALIFYSINNIISGISLFDNKKLKKLKKIKKIKKFINNWITLLPIGYTKFMNFLVLDRLLRVLDKYNRDILSNSLIFTSTFFIYDIIIFLVTDILDCNADNIIIFQLLFGILVILFYIICGKICCCSCCSRCCCSCCVRCCCCPVASN